MKKITLLLFALLGLSSWLAVSGLSLRLSQQSDYSARWMQLNEVLPEQPFDAALARKLLAPGPAEVPKLFAPLMQVHPLSPELSQAPAANLEEALRLIDQIETLEAKDLPGVIQNASSQQQELLMKLHELSRQAKLLELRLTKSTENTSQLFKELSTLAQDYSKAFSVSLAGTNNNEFLFYESGYLEGLPRLVGVRSQATNFEAVLVSLRGAGSKISNEKKFEEVREPFVKTVPEKRALWESSFSQDKELKNRLSELLDLSDEKRALLLRELKQKVLDLSKPKLASEFQALEDGLRG